MDAIVIFFMFDLVLWWIAYRVATVARIQPRRTAPDMSNGQ